MFKAVLLTAALILAGCASTPPPTVTTTGRTLAARIETEAGLSNFARVDDRLYRGAQPTAEGYRNLRKMGVKTVINFRSNHDYRAEAEAAGLAYISMPVQADVWGSEPPTDEQVRIFFDTVLDPARGPVYIHCMGGKDRTGTMCALYRMEVQGWTTAEAIEEMQAFGFHDNYVDLMEFVQAYKLKTTTGR
jgi:protein tyrosine/serine phosphatase